MIKVKVGDVLWYLQHPPGKDIGGGGGVGGWRGRGVEGGRGGARLKCAQEGKRRG